MLGTVPLRILVVEDDEADANHLTALVARSGPTAATATTASSLSAALRRVGEEAFDAVLLDLTLPDCSGVEVATRFRAAAPDVPLVVLTGEDDDGLLEDAQEAGAEGTLPKASSSDRLVMRVIRRAIERHGLVARLEQSLAEARSGEAKLQRAMTQTLDLQTRLVHADRLAAVGHLAAEVAHEVNNPAAFILANQTMIRECVDKLALALAELTALASSDPDAARREQALGIVAAAAVDDNLRAIIEMLADNTAGMNRIRAIVRDLRSFSRMEDNDVEDVHLSDVIDLACAMVSGEVRERARLVKAVGALPPLAGDRGKLAQLLMNLLLNAAQAIEPGAAERNTIRVAAREEGGAVVLTVEDSGVGMSEEVRARAFEPFFTTKPPEVGTGLGLSMCADIVRKHGGEITVVSGPGKGTRVEVVLPVQTEGLVVPPAAGSGERPPSRSVKVLIIDDEPSLLAAYRRMLDPPHTVVVAQGGADGLEMLATHGDIELVLCDLMMPDVDGPRVYDELLQTAPDMVDRLVFCTGGAFTPRARDFVTRVRNTFLEKPISRDKLLEVISRVPAKE